LGKYAELTNSDSKDLPANAKTCVFINSPKIFNSPSSASNAVK
jgi:hypothetical protein